MKRQKIPKQKKAVAKSSVGGTSKSGLVSRDDGISLPLAQATFIEQTKTQVLMLAKLGHSVPFLHKPPEIIFKNIL